MCNAVYISDSIATGIPVRTDLIVVAHTGIDAVLEGIYVYT